MVAGRNISDWAKMIGMTPADISLRGMWLVEAITARSHRIAPPYHLPSIMHRYLPDSLLEKHHQPNHDHEGQHLHIKDHRRVRSGLIEQSRRELRHNPNRNNERAAIPYALVRNLIRHPN
jgi:hypothetical protein